MSKISVCFCYPFIKPREPASLVMFAESQPAVPEDEAPAYLRKSMEYAKQYKVYLLPGLFILKKRLCLCLISPQGKPLAIQKATHLNLLHHAACKPAARIEPVDTELGRLFLAPDVDIFHPEVARSAAMLGADAILCSQYYDLYDVNLTRIMTGCWDAAQQNQISVLCVSNQNCCVTAPCGATQDHSGFVLSPQADFPAIATLYPHKAEKLRETNGILNAINPQFCARYFAHLDH